MLLQPNVIQVLIVIELIPNLNHLQVSKALHVISVLSETPAFDVPQHLQGLSGLCDLNLRQRETDRARREAS